MRIPEPRKAAAWERPARRTVDLVASIVGLVLLSPLIAVIAVIIRRTSPGPAFFRQTRVGENGRSFTLFKFRTMRVDADDTALRDLVERELRGEDTMVDGSTKVHADPRITRVGSLLRRTSLDELPQLFNVLRGEMSLVGPRPCLEWEREIFPTEYDDRYAVLPGITGLWQVSGRSTLSSLDMLQLDVAYARGWGFWRDLEIIVRTVPSLLRKDGAR